MSQETDLLLDRAAQGDLAASEELFARHRDRLRRMVHAWLDGRVKARVDPSDVVQDTLAEAHRLLQGYLPGRPMPFYLWLRKIASQRIDKVHRTHLRAQRRSVNREERRPMGVFRSSVHDLANKLVASSTSPSQHLQREEVRRRTRAALAELSERDYEFLMLRYVEQLSMKEIAEIIGATEAAVKMRHVRALSRLSAKLQSP